MDPFPSGEGRIDLDAEGKAPAPSSNGVHPAGIPTPSGVPGRRADIDQKQERLVEVLEAVGCEAVLLLLPAHVAWFTCGLNVRGLIADSERPGVYTNGRQRWLLCSNIDTQRFFDEELDQLGFQLKEWSWAGGRAELLMNVTTGRKIAGDRPLPNMPLVNERLRPLIRVLSAVEQEAYRDLGRVLVHAIEATARTLAKGQTEQEIAGQVGHRLLHRGADVVGVSVTADERGARFRRAGFSSAPVTTTCVVQATAHRDGLYATASRAISFGPPPDEFRRGFERALRLAALYRVQTLPGETLTSARSGEQAVLAGTSHEFDGRLSQPGYGTGRVVAEELRRGGQDEKLVEAQAVVWQPRVGPAAVVDTHLVSANGADCITPPEDWPFKRVSVHGRTHDIPDMLIR